MSALRSRPAASSSGAAEGDADAGADDDLVAQHADLAPQGGEQPLAEHVELADVLDTLQEHGELVTAEPRDRVDGAHAADQSSGDDLEQLVPLGVAEPVVDALEAVQVEEQHRQRGAAAPGAVHGLLDPVEEEGPVGQRRSGRRAAPAGPSRSAMASRENASSPTVASASRAFRSASIDARARLTAGATSHIVRWPARTRAPISFGSGPSSRSST